MPRRERSSSAPKIAGVFLVRTITPKHLFHRSGHNQAVEQRLRSKNTDFSGLRTVPPRSIDIRAGDDRNQRVRRPDLASAASPTDLSTALFKSIRDVGIAGNQCSRCGHWQQPFQCIVPIYMERAGEDVFLIEHDVEE